MTKSLGGTLAELLRRWWRIDRIRVSPRSGRLLRLEPPCLLSIDGQTIEIVGRTAAPNGSGAAVLYDCRTTNGTATLAVGLSAPGRPLSIVWQAGDEECELLEEELEVWG